MYDRLFPWPILLYSYPLNFDSFNLILKQSCWMMIWITIDISGQLLVLNQLKQVYGPFGQSNMLSTFSWILQWSKEYIERRHGEPFKFLFLPKMGLLGSQAVLEKKVQFWIMSNFLAILVLVHRGSLHGSFLQSPCNEGILPFLSSFV
jgi:hypothetical protein